MSGPFLIRAAQADDLAAVVDLIRALARFEHLPGPDEAAAERLRAHAFGRERYFEILVAERAGSIVGYAVYFMTYSTFLARPSLYLEDIFVDPGSRRRGIATSFLRELASIAVARGCGRFEWTVLDWNVAAMKFYESLGAVVLPDWRVCRVEGGALAALGRTDP
jgi:GNAT superfamily N-acetyltransferase